MRIMFLLYLFFQLIILSDTLYSNNDYFPLTTGSKWTYLMHEAMNNRTDTMFVEITGNMPIGQHEYSVFKYVFTQPGPEPYSESYKYFRTDSNYIYSLEKSTDQIMYKFDVDIGALWEYFPDKKDFDNRNYSVVKKNYSIEKNGVSYDNCIAIYSESKFALDADLYEEFSDGIGLIGRSNSLGGNWFIVSYRIATDIPPLETNLNKISVAPNPARDYVEISASNVILSEAKDPGIRIYDVLGIVQSTSPLPLSMLGEGNMRIDVSHLSPGVYFVRVGEIVRKFIKI